MLFVIILVMNTNLEINTKQLLRVIVLFLMIISPGKIKSDFRSAETLFSYYCQKSVPPLKHHPIPYLQHLTNKYIEYINFRWLLTYALYGYGLMDDAKRIYEQGLEMQKNVPIKLVPMENSYFYQTVESLYEKLLDS
jgi:hypothetical protein